jgi:uncharacterized RDD family membrane protein YckC
MTTAERYINEVLRSMPAATPQRSQIALELRGHIAERMAAGQPFDEVVRQLGSPAALAESYLSAVPLVAPPLSRRFFAKLVDFVSAFLVLVPFGWFAWAALPRTGFAFAFVPLLLLVGGSLLFAVGTVLGEYWFGQTLGKRLLGLRVVRVSGASIGLGQAFVRVLPVALEGVFPVDAAFVFFTEKQQRAFELLSKTRVVSVSCDPVA